MMLLATSLIVLVIMFLSFALVTAVATEPIALALVISLILVLMVFYQRRASELHRTRVETDRYFQELKENNRRERFFLIDSSNLNVSKTPEGTDVEIPRIGLRYRKR